MTKNKVIALLVLIIISLVVYFIYFNYWQEPMAKYIGTDNPKLTRVRKDLEELKAELREKGLYTCCIQNDCNWCALHLGQCTCVKLVIRKGHEKSCCECAAAWNRKQGKFPGVDPDAIEVTTFGVYGFEKDEHHPNHNEDKGQ
jgi:hypothetical protein